MRLPATKTLKSLLTSTSRRKPTGILTVAILVAISLVTIGGIHQKQSHDKVVRAKAVQEAQTQHRTELKIQAQEDARLDAAKSDKPKEQKATTGAKTVGNNPTSAPKSTAASKPGDVMPNNSQKPGAYYFAGHLVFSPSTVTISKSNYTPAMVTISTPDGVPVVMPAKSWDNRDSYFFAIPMSAASLTTARLTSWNMQLEAQSMPLGTFQAYAVTHKDDNVDTWEYSGYLIVNVVE